ncbi:hypothetical protein Athai_32380 [Actinocatenispora thailandica]|uniref:DUF3303 domain-containing protein n=1 Tax=Actinocatenispora thailandica TaxID=227318 RepID=A0A7R7DQE5_9ACTN|nr:hypothetical protein [Actinocatenispora thailandica]BCJ35735.1 hypothetical protein Athai_32380 [Actinocatenispora thailandica]
MGTIGKAVMAMRTVMRFEIDTGAGNDLLKDGALQKGLDRMLEMLKPEAAYFFPMNGCRGGILVFDLADPSQLVSLTEPMWTSMRARIDVSPAMSLDDLRAGLGSLASS